MLVSEGHFHCLSGLHASLYFLFLSFFFLPVYLFFLSFFFFLPFPCFTSLPLVSVCSVLLLGSLSPSLSLVLVCSLFLLLGSLSTFQFAFLLEFLFIPLFYLFFPVFLSLSSYHIFTLYLRIFLLLTLSFSF